VGRLLREVQRRADLELDYPVAARPTEPSQRAAPGCHIAEVLLVSSFEASAEGPRRGGRGSQERTVSSFSCSAGVHAAVAWSIGR
jgi:hypothetical protein